MLRTNRYLVIASVIGCVAVVCLVLVYRQLAFSSLVDHQTRSNVALTQVFSNSIWPNYRHLVETPDGGLGAIDPEIQAMDADVRMLMKGSQVVKVKIYDMKGLTIYSSDLSQIGENKGDNEGFVSAIAGETASNITYRDQFDAFEGRRSNLDVVSSYIPIRRSPTDRPEAVFEVYSDVTDLVERMRNLQWAILIVVLGSVAALYLLLVVVARRADRAEATRLEEAARNEARIRHQAYHDPVTELPNRMNFQHNLERAVERAKRDGHTLVVMYLDVDRFKLVNDSLGHDAGDELLRSIADRLRSCVRHSDILYRVGGDEFTILPEGLRYPEEAADLAQRILEEMNDPFVITGQSIVSSVSIGLSAYPQDDHQPGKLVKNADAAMYLAKRSGRNRYCFYTADLDKHAGEQLAFESSLKNALANEEFRLHYQPRLAADGSTTVGFEALLRWQRTNGKLVLPNDFIPELEQIGLISDVGKWVLREACGRCKSWQEAGYAPVRISVNVSPSQLREKDFALDVAEALKVARLDARWLELELTENILLHDPDEAIGVMRTLKEIGIVLSIDDFGAGYSSFNYLKLLPVDYLKVDRSLVSDLDESPRGAAIVAGIAGVAKSLGIGLVAEGVETSSQARHLTGIGCDELQGSFYSEPLPASSVEDWLTPGDAETVRDRKEKQPSSRVREIS